MGEMQKAAALFNIQDLSSQGYELANSELVGDEICFLLKLIHVNLPSFLGGLNITGA